MTSLKNETRKQVLPAAATLIVLAVALTPVAGQTPPPAPLMAPANCAPSSPPPGSAAAPQPGSDAAKNSPQPAENLSARLSRSEGVICPPANLDTEMKAPTPQGGNTPVIPPPGSPGGDPTIRPK